ncbi:MAG: LamG domain-containing protein [Planctomycetota bacterium]
MCIPSKVGYALLSIVVFSALPLLAQEPPKKDPVPTADAQTEATKLVKEVYGDEWAKARTSAEKQALAKKLLGKAMDTQDDPASKYVLLRLAKDIATQSRDGQTAFKTIDAMAESFQVDATEMKLAVLTKLVTGAEKPAQHKAIAEQSLKLVNVAISQDNFKVADELGKLALAEARKAVEKELIAHVQGRIAEIAELFKAYDDMKAARVTLEKTPDNPESNMVMGKYLCFVKGDWDKGLLMLALGKDETLKALAKRELAGAASSAEQTKLGNDWWDFAEKQEGMAKKQIQARAGHWYQEALPGLAGLTKDKVEKRMTQGVLLTEEGRLPSGVVLLFTFDKATFYRRGGKLYVKDLSGKGNHGIVNGANLVEGRVGSALSFGGKDQCVECKNSESLNPTKAITICAWVKAHSWGSADIHNLVTKESNEQGSVRGYYLRLCGVTVSLLELTISNGNWHGTRCPPCLELGRWYHLAGTYDGDKLKVFVDGNLRSSSEMSGAMPPSSSNLKVGAGPPSWSFDGVMDEVAVFDRALTDKEIQSVWRLGLQGKSLAK